MIHVRAGVGRSLRSVMDNNMNKDYMILAIEEAKKSAEPLKCGAVIVRDGKVVAQSHNTQRIENNATTHAEINAILNCEHRPRGATLYCTSRPCVKWDKYPGCLQFCAAAGLAEVVYNKNSSNHMCIGDDAEWEVAVWLLRDKLKVRGVNFTPRK